MTVARQMLETMEFLGRHHAETASAEEKERFSLALDALSFIMAFGQTYGFEEYRQDIAAQGPPVVIAAFDTREKQVRQEVPQVTPARTASHLPHRAGQP